MIQNFFLKPSPITAVQVTTDPQRTALNRIDIAELTNGRANPGSQRSDAFVVELPTGGTIAKPGDWIVKHENGDLGVFTDADFLAAYEPAAIVPHDPDEKPEAWVPGARAENTGSRPAHEAIAVRAEKLSEARRAAGQRSDPEADWTEAEAQLTREQA